MGQLTTEGVQWSSPDGKVSVVCRARQDLFDEDEYTRRIEILDEGLDHEVQVIQVGDDGYLEKIEEAILWAEGYHQGMYIEGDEE